MPGLLCCLLLLLQLVCAARECPPYNRYDELEYKSESFAVANGSLIRLSRVWAAVGPFPAGMREHQMGAFPALAMYSPSDLFNVSHPVQVPSAYGKDGLAGVKEVSAEDLVENTDGRSSLIGQSVTLEYLDLDWSLLRKSTGWAGMQWQAMLVSDLVVEGSSPATVGLNLGSGAELTILSEADFLAYNPDDPAAHTQWYNGDWYRYSTDKIGPDADVPMHLRELAPGRYRLLVKSLSEIRIFGDSKTNRPSLTFDLYIKVSTKLGLRAITTTPFSIAPDIVDGQFAGWGVSFPLSNEGDSAIEVLSVTLVGDTKKVRGLLER
jgi:hypothetical protein